MKSYTLRGIIGSTLSLLGLLGEFEFEPFIIFSITVDPVYSEPDYTRL